ncbi:MAG TPA: DUF3035 domain-containing protein [Rickettsiales bacterium]|nr:DUF3035 domain-containing protein [Rickettsiales bacterium]
MKIKQNMVILTCLLLAACGNGDGLRETLGLNRHGPDEFQVVSRPPLTLPPDYSLRPPREGESPNFVPGTSMRQQAHDTILGTSQPMPGGIAPTAVQPVSSGDLPSSADSRFLANAGADKGNPNIRTLLNDPSATPPQDTKYLIMPGANSDSVVDPSKEKERLKKDKQQNLPPTAGGDTPTLQPQSRGIFGDLF